MTIAFVHGNPETTAIWEPLLRELGRDDAIALAPPGFGAPVPDGFDASADAYAQWLTTELERLADADGAPVDLVGHDWGGGHVVRAASARPDLIRRWCTDIAGCYDPDYVWHDAAQVWQKAGEGEESVAAMAAAPLDARAALFESLGMTPAAAASCAAAVADPEMGRCILALYRSAAQPAMTRWGAAMPQAASDGRSLVVVATEDHYTGGALLAQRTAARWGAQVATLDGLGHWWMLQDPGRGASMLRAFFD